MNFLILEIFDRESLKLHYPWYLYAKIHRNNYNHKYIYECIFSNGVFSTFQLMSIREKMVK